jgi:CHAT domain-containing protein/Tfp pilus assembly protein PilF
MGLGDLGDGIVVDAVDKNFEGEKAGLQPGDILLHWTRDGANGQIASPFDLSWVEVEQAPRGDVTLEGLRRGEKRAWLLGAGSWAVHTRANLPESLLSVYVEGQKLAAEGKLKEATLQFRAAADRAKEWPSAWLAPWFLFHAGELLADARQWKESDAAYQEAENQTAGDAPAIRSQLLRAWAATFEQRADWASVEKYCQEAGANLAPGPESLFFADTLDCVADATIRRGEVSGDLAKAERSYSRAQEIQKTLAPGGLGIARTLNGLGYVATVHGDLVKAEQYYRESLSIRQKLSPDSLDVASSLMNLGGMFYRRSDFSKAEEYYGKALAIRENLAPGSLKVAGSLDPLGNVAVSRGDLEKADEYYRRSLEIKEKLAPESLELAATLNNLGNVALARRDLAKDEEYQRQALKIRERLAPGGLGVAASLHNLGIVAEERGDLANAESFFRLALAIKEKVAPGSLILAHTLDSLGALAQQRGDLNKAEEYYGQALLLEEKLAPASLEFASGLNSLGSLARMRGDLVKAEEYERQALAIYEKKAPGNVDSADTLNVLGDVARDRGDITGAEQYYRRALEIWEQLAPQRASYAETLAALAGIALQKQQFEAAVPLFEKALDVLEGQMRQFGGGEETRSRYRALHASGYQDYVDLLVRQKQPERAFEVLERSRARTLLEVLGSHRANITKTMTSEERTGEARLQMQLASLNRQFEAERSSAKPDTGRLATLNSDLEKAQLQYSDFQASLYAAHPELQAQRGQIEPVSVDEAAGLLPNERCAFLEFMVAEGKTYLFVLTRSSRDHASKPELNVYSIDMPAKDLEHEAEQFRRQLAQRDLRFGEAAKRLYRLLLRPAQPQLSQVDALLIVPDGPLWNLPFQALEPRPGHYLLEDHAVAYASSLTILREMVRLRLRNRNTTRNSATADLPSNTGAAADHVSATLLAMGNPILGTATSEVAQMTYRDGTLAPLPEAAREVKTLQGVYGRQQSRVFVGMAASEEQFKAHAGAFRILHLATHGYLNDTSPMYSHLLLSPGNDKKEDGLLQTWEIMNLDLHADLAVLSACETARGRVTTGEGVIGLAWAFFVAGVPTTIVSQWSVESGSTARLMIAFHRERKITEKNADPFGTARALQRAELKLLHSPKYSAPFYWAGFITLGDPR